MLFNPINILVIEDNPGDFFLIETCLHDTRIDTKHILHAQTLQQGILTLSSHTIDLILLDLTLPDSIAGDSYHQIHSCKKDIPVIILSGSKNEEMALDIVKQGAQDYLIKDELNPKILEKTILYSIERKRNLTLLDQSQAQYRVLFDNNPLPMWTYDVETLKFEMVNDAAIEHYGYTRNDFLGMTILEIRPEEEKQRAKDFNFTDRTNRLKKSGEWTHLKKNGDIIRVDITSHLINFNGKRSKLIVVYDITEQVKAKEELATSEQVFRSLVESFPNGAISLLDSDFNFLYTNGIEYQKLGINPNLNLGKQFLWRDCYKNDKKRVFLELEKCLAGETVSFEFSGIDSVYTSVAAPIFSDHGIAEKIIVITQDITDKYKTEQHLKLLESVIVNSSNGIIIVANKMSEKGDLKITFANKAQQDITGYSLRELLGKNPRIFQGTETDPKTIECFRTAINKHKNASVEVINYKKDGTPYWVNVSIVPMFNTKRKCTHFIGLSIDITERKIAEQAMLKANEELLEKNNRLYEIAMINSHTIRKPVANILGAMDLIDKSLIDNIDLMEVIEKIELSALELDSAILDVAKKAL